MNILTVTLNPSIDISASAGKVEPEKKVRCKAPSYESGGGGINVSKALKNLGVPSTALYTCGGHSGKAFIDLIDGYGIESIPVPIKEHTRQNVSVFDEATGKQYRMVMPGPNISDDELKKIYDDIRKLDPVPDIVVVSGSLPPGVPSGFAANIAKMGREFGFKTVADMKGRPLAETIEKGVYFAKPNVNEFRSIIGNEKASMEEIEQVARRMIYNEHCEMILISLGAEGALFVSKERVDYIRSVAVKPKSKVGAGDSMTAGVICALAGGKSLYEAALYGVAAGTAAVLTPGSKLCRKDDTEDIYKKLLVENEAVV